MAKASTKLATTRKNAIEPYNTVLTEVSSLLEQARRMAARSVNALMTATYWEIGQRIVTLEQKGSARAQYGEALINRLSTDLTARFGRGFSRQNLQQMRQFYLLYPQGKICQTVSGKSPKRLTRGSVDLPKLAQAFPLPWSHYVRLSSVKSEYARSFYETEALRGGWTIRQLDRQIGSQFYERTALSRNKAAMLTKGGLSQPSDCVTPDEEVKDSFILEFLNLKDEYSETELEEALIHHLESFLLELGNDFTFVGRQRRLRVGDTWFRLDLLFFHRRLKCLIIIDLKLDKFSHADVGQMNLYLNYARRHWMHSDENPPIGLILSAGQNAAEVSYAMEGLSNKVLAAEYRTILPEVETIAAELNRTRKLLVTRKATRAKSRRGK